MPQVFVGVGSNIQREFHIQAGVAALTQCFGEIRCSSIYDTEAVGFEGDNFLNMVVCFESSLPVSEINERLTAIEDSFQRQRNDVTKFCSRNLDLDLLLYGTEVIDDGVVKLPRADVYRYAYVIKPLLDLSQGLRDPVSNRSFLEIWEEIEPEGKQQIRIFTE